VSLAVVGLYVGLMGHEQTAASAGAWVFALLVVANAVLILPSRSRHRAWRRLFSGLTPVSLWVLTGTLLALGAVVLVPPLAQAFGFVALSAPYAALALILGCALLLPFQLSKRWFG
jgi:Ca2+-transporting ATPase